MSDSAPFNPLLAVAESYVVEAVPSLGSEKQDSLRQVLSDLIESKITAEKACQIFQKEISTTRPVDRLVAILNVPEAPIQAQNDNMQPHFTTMNGTRKKTHPWNDYEDQRLLCGINRFGLDNWAEVSSFVGNGRTRAQCSQRWFRGLDPRISKVLWTREEETRLMELIHRLGERSWTKIAGELGNRSDAQCRYHYKQMLKEGIVDQDKQNNIKLSTIASAPPSMMRSEIANLGPLQVHTPPTKQKLPPISSILENLQQPVPTQKGQLGYSPSVKFVNPSPFGYLYQGVQYNVHPC